MPKTPSFILKKIEECRAKQAKSLDLCVCDDFGEIRLIAIPPEVFTLSHLESLDLRDNAIQVVPDEIKQLTQLKRLDLRGNPLRQVADVAGLFVHYADFVKLNLPPKNIIGLKLTLFSHDAPEHIFELPNLTALEISNHRLTQIPDWVLKLEKLTELDVSRNRLRETSGLETLINLSSLDLSINQLNNLSGLKTLVNLSSLDLSYNRLNSLLGLETLVNLSSLDLSSNQLSSLSGIETLVNLSSLNLRNNPLSSLSGIETLVNLSSLDLSRNQLSSLSGLETLVNISSLDLSYNQLSSLSGLETLVNLSSLNLSSNQLSSLSGLETLVNLSSLDLSSNELNSLSGLETLVNLSSLDLSSNELNSLSGLETLVNLSSLDLSSNELNSLSGLETLVNPSSLNLSSNQLSSLSGIEKLVNLSSLNLSSNQLSSWSELETLVNLSSLNLSSNPLSSLSGIEMLLNLFSLDLSSNELSSLSGIEMLLNLSSLSLSSNPLSSLSGLETLVNLSSLDLRYNQLGSLSGLETLVNLSSLDLSYNQLSSLSGIEKLVNLSSLDLGNNQLNSLSGIEKLFHLTTLNIGENKTLEKLDDELFKLPKLENLRLFEFLKRETAITYPPLEQLELEGSLGAANLFRVRNYLRQLAAGEVVHLYEAKLLIVGEGGAGKTTLARKIKNVAYQLPAVDIDSTEGIDVIKWQFPYNHEHTYRVNIWDFGGQEIYHATHQFFLTQNALYLLVADNRKEDTDFYYWLNVVKSLSDNSPLLLIKNEKLGRQWEISESALRAEFSNFRETYATDLKTCSNNFTQFITEILPYYLRRLPHIGKALPKTWLTIRNILEADPRNYIELGEFLSLCEQHDFKHKEDKLHLSKTLHELGTILHFQEEPLLENTIFLKPHWATTAVYHVLDNAQVKANHGKFTHQQVKDIWYEPEYDFMHNELLQLMVKFKLCYPLSYCKNTYIAPQLLRENPPDYELPTQDSVTVYYKGYEFMPKGMVRQLIVVLHEYIAEKQHLVWKNGVVLEKDQTRAEIIENYGKREIKICVVGQNRRDLMSIVMYELNKIHASYHNRLEYEVLLPCSCEEPDYFNFEKLKEFEADRAAIQCQKRGCRKLLDARYLIEGVLNVKDDRKSGDSSVIHIGKVENFQQAGDHSHLENRSVRVSDGSTAGVISTGDHNNIHYNENIPSHGIQTDIENLRKLLSSLPLNEADKSKGEKLVNTLATEAKKPVPDTEEASNALERIFKLIEKTGKLSEAIKTQLVPIGKNLGEWLGEDGKTLMAFLSAKFLGM
ncbi:MAG: COR domain-containing protein [Thiotrichaceae bacterium]|nr:COR domain-containing protein [Thiotrichaceae bacterium]